MKNFLKEKSEIPAVLKIKSPLRLSRQIAFIYVFINLVKKQRKLWVHGYSNDVFMRFLKSCFKKEKTVSSLKASNTYLFIKVGNKSYLFCFSK